MTLEQLQGALEEVEVTKEQVTELHGYLTDQGIDVVGQDGRLPTSEAARVEAAAAARKANQNGTAEVSKKPEIRRHRRQQHGPRTAGVFSRPRPRRPADDDLARV
ncbi:MAG: RNA polymerase sigma factor region1.1 domain-containing protein, partial [Baekduiaceae bacterium]